MRNLPESVPSERQRAAAHLNPLAVALMRSMPDIPMRWEHAAGRPCLTLDVPAVGPVRIFVGKGWFWTVVPRRALCPLTDRRRAAAMITDAIRAASARESRPVRIVPTAPAGRHPRGARGTRRGHARTRYGSWAVAS